MANQLNLDAQHLDDLSALVIAAPPYKPAYDQVLSWVQSESGVGESTKLFFRFAGEVNANEATPANHFIRIVTQVGLDIDAADSSPQHIQDISDNIAEAVFAQISDDQGIPQLVTILGLDVSASIGGGGQTLGGWGGSLFYLDQRIGSNQTEPESVALMVFSSASEVSKFETANITAGRATIAEYGISPDLFPAMGQAVRAGLSASVGPQSDLDAVQRVQLMHSAVKIGASIFLGTDEFREQLNNWFTSSIYLAPSSGDEEILIEATSDIEVQRAQDSARFLESIAGRVATSAIVVRGDTVAAVFGSDQANNLVAINSESTTLYGGGGNDHLFGGDANDTLLGEGGFDTYHFGNGGGSDTIIDNDGSGAIEYDGEVLTGGVYDSDLGVYVSDDGDTFEWDEGVLSINGGLLTVAGFANGDLGIVLEDEDGDAEDDLDSDDDPDENDPNEYEPEGSDPRQRRKGQSPLENSGEPLQNVEEQFNQSALAPSPGSPLVLDLDGDGTESLPISAGAHFDLDANGFAERIGWTGSDDGLLALDRDDDGRIESGRELFGTETILANSENAANGFLALAEWDANADGKIDATDAVWADLRVWQDKNSDGYNTPDELFTLSELDIQSIQLGSTTGPGFDDQGNNQWLVGSYTLTGGVVRAATDYLFPSNTVYTVPEEILPVTSTIAALPDVSGFGTVHDLHQAMVRDSSGDLQELIESFSQETHQLSRNALLLQILYKWAGADGVSPTSRGSAIDARKLATLEAFMGRGFVGSDGPNPTSNSAPSLYLAFENLGEYVYAQLMAQTHLESQFDAITYQWDTQTEQMVGDVAAVMTQLEAALASDFSSGVILAGEFVRVIKALGVEDSLNLDVFDSNATLAALVAGAEVHGGTLADDEILGSAVTDFIFGDAGNDWLDGGSANDTIEGGSGNDYLFGGSGNDSLSGGSGNDILDDVSGSGNDLLDGGDGDDTLYARDGNDTLNGGAGVDRLLGGGGDDIVNGGDGNDRLFGSSGDDVLDGGAGNDYLGGGDENNWSATTGWGNDTYLFGRGSGQDIVYDQDSTAGNVDTIRLAPDVLPEDVTVRLAGSLFITINDTGDTLAVTSWSNGAAGQIERIEFANGTVYDQAYLSALTPTGTEGADAFSGTPNSETMLGLGGDDSLEGLAGNDTIDGGSGDDWLDGGSGDDTLEGGSGNDYFFGGSGNDILRGGAGNDVLDDSLFGTGGGGNDVLEGGDGDDSLYAREGSDTLSGDAGADRLLGGGGDDIVNGGSGNDRLFGSSGDDVLDGGAGNDYLGGGDENNWSGTYGWGNDTYLFGRGSGQDTVHDQDSTEGNVDTIQFGDGVDIGDVQVSRSGNDAYLTLLQDGSTTADVVTILNGFTAAGKVEQLRFADGTVVAFDDLVVGDGSANSLSGSSNANIVSGLDGDDTMSGGAGNDALHGDSGNDTVNGEDGSDVLYGGSGTDNLDGGAGDDYLAGGTEDDQLAGTGGSDILQGGSGADSLDGGEGANLLDGGDGNDELYGGDDQTFIAGGEGDDVIHTGDGQNVIVHNAGHGHDTVHVTSSSETTISLGGGIGYEDLSFSKDGNDLVLNTGADDSIRLTDWYNSPPNSYPIPNLQVILDAASEFDENSEDPLYNKRVQTFDMWQLAWQFGQALAANPELESWQLMQGLEGAHVDGSNSAAIGGDLAYWYGRNNGLTGIGNLSALGVLGTPGFGSDAQSLQPFTGLQEGFVKLS